MTLLKDINNYLRKNLDKVAHFGISYVLTQILAFLVTPIPALILIFLGGLYYEVNGNNDWKDLLADLLGCILGAVIISVRGV